MLNILKGEICLLGVLLYGFPHWCEMFIISHTQRTQMQDLLQPQMLIEKSENSFCIFCFCVLNLIVYRALTKYLQHCIVFNCQG